MSTLNLNPCSTPCCTVMEEQAKARSVLRDDEIKQEEIGSLFKNYTFLLCSTMSCQGKLVGSSPTLEHIFSNERSTPETTICGATSSVRAVVGSGV